MNALESEGQVKWKMWALLLVCFASWYLSHLFQSRRSPLNATLMEQIGSIASAVSVGSVLVYCYKRWLWRLRFLHPWFESTPLVCGCYEGSVTRLIKAGAKDVIEVLVNVKITQPSAATVFYLQTHKNKTAEVYTESCQLFLSKNSKICLGGLYEMAMNELHPDTLGSMKSYLGAIRLELNDSTFPTELSGSYWSTIDTRGRIELKRVS